MIGIDLFAGAGGLSLGAEMAGIDVKYAVENDQYAAKAYEINHKTTVLYNTDIRKVSALDFSVDNECLILFGGPPCQGFSTSNQKTRNKDNPQNWLFKEFVRLAREIKPKWILLENVKGIAETEHGFFEHKIKSEFEKLGYLCSIIRPCAVDYGVPQRRTRFFLIGSKEKRVPILTISGVERVSVKDALEDLPSLKNGASENILPYKCMAKSSYARLLRGKEKACSGHLVSRNSDLVIKRYAHIPPGGNWADIPDELMGNYTDKTRCHTGVYKRLKEDEPALTVGNYRKSMIIHPWEDRGLSVREAARLQSFPDSYTFYGSIGFQQQQVGNAVPPLLAKAVFEAIIEADSIGDDEK